MIGQGVLRECLLDPDVDPGAHRSAGIRPVSVTRSCARSCTRISSIFTPIRNELAGYGACFFCLGITSAGMNEADYRRVTYDIAMAAARTLVELNPDNDVHLRLGRRRRQQRTRSRHVGAREGRHRKRDSRSPFQERRTCFGRRSCSRCTASSREQGWYNAFYRVLGPIYPVLSRLAPGYTLTTEQIGKAMLQVARTGGAKASPGESRHSIGYAQEVTPLPDRLIRAFNELSGSKRTTESIVPRRTFSDVILPEQDDPRTGSGAGAGHQPRSDLSSVGSRASAIRPALPSPSTSPGRRAPARRSAPRQSRTRWAAGC